MIRLTLCALGTTLLAACGSAPTAPEATVTPNANLVVQGIPSVPQSLADGVGQALRH